MSSLRRLWRDEGGGTLVETAISFVLLSTLIFGAFEGSFAVYSYHFLANAAHEGTRYAIVRGGSWGTSCDNAGGYNASACFASADNVASWVASRNFPGINLTAAQVCTQFLSATPGSVPTTCTKSTTVTNNTPGNIVQVTITYPFTLSIPGVPANTFTLTSTSQMVIAQ